MKSEHYLHIETRITGSLGNICYQDGGWRVSVATAAVCMGMEMGMQTGHRGAYNQPPSQE